MLSDQHLIGLLLSVLALAVACGVTGFNLGRLSAQRLYLAQIQRMVDISNG